MRNLLFLFLIVILAGCSENQNNKVENIEYNCVLKNDTVNLELDFRANIELPREEFLQDSIVKYVFGEEKFDKPIKRVLKNYAINWFETLSNNKEYHSIALKNTISLNADITYRDSTYLSYARSLDCDGDNFLTITTWDYRTSVFDVKTGEVLTEEDLFGADYKRKVHRLLVKYATPLRNDTILPTEEDDLYSNDQIQPNGRFILTDSTVMYIFHKYEIAYGVFGNIFIDIPKSEFEIFSK